MGALRRASLVILAFIFTGCALHREVREQRSGEVLSTEISGNDACSEHLLSMAAQGKFVTNLQREMEEYPPLVEESLTYRAKTIATANRLKERMDAGKPASGEDLDLLNRGIVSHLDLRDKLYRVAESHECWLDLKPGVANRLGMTPEAQLEGVMMSLSAALVLYDNYLLGVSLFEEDGRLRRMINHKDQGYGISRDRLTKVAAEYSSANNRQRVRAAMQYYEDNITKVPPIFLNDPKIQYLNLLITQSPSYAMTRKASPLAYLGRKLGFMAAVSEDGVVGAGKEGMNLFSMLFGNAVGLVETRHGKLYKREDVAVSLKGRLQAGDILLEKTPFRLTDKLIPGHWGHAAIWIGTEQELRELGIWDDPLVAKYRQEIGEGRLIVEALRSGVEMNTLDHFLNIDDIGVLRKPDMTKAERARVILLALRQVGKAYDFNFDVETTDRIVCSELVYVVYTSIEWPTEKMLGRATISPDNVASKAINGGPLRIVAFYHDGQEVRENPEGVMAELMRKSSPDATGKKLAAVTEGEHAAP